MSSDKKIKVLLVEGDVKDRESTKRQLEKWGFDVEITSNLNLQNESKPSLVLRDLHALEKIAKRSAEESEVDALRDKVRKLGTFGKLNGSTAKMKAIFKLVQVMAPTTAPV